MKKNRKKYIIKMQGIRGMKEKKKNVNLTEREKKGTFPGDSVRSFTILTAWAFLAVAIIIGSNVFPLDARNQVYAASDAEEK